MAGIQRDESPEDVYRRIWDGGPYASFGMIEYLISKIEIPGRMRAFLHNPDILQEVSANEIRKDNIFGRLRPLWDGNTGLCTSFAIKVVHELQGNGGKYRFVFHDTNGHRFARCTATRVVIDSSEHAPCKLRDGTSLVIGRNTCWIRNSNLRSKNGSTQEVRLSSYHQTSNSAASIVIRVCKAQSVYRLLQTVL
jgi:hypothetical protein